MRLNSVVLAEAERYQRPSAFLAAMVLATGLIATPVSVAGDSDHDRGNDRHGSSDFRIETLSTKPHLVSGGDVLVRINVSRDVSLRETRVELNGKNITGVFHADSKARTLTGLVTGLKLGKNELEVSSKGRGDGSARLTLTNYSVKGPILSGPYLQPFICQTQDFALPDGTTLGAPLDADCSVATRVHYLYRSTAAGALKPLPSTTSLPADVAMTMTLTGATVRFIVRLETGTMNRGIYQNAILHDPTSDPPPSPFSPPKGWNTRLLAQHGAGCPGGWYVQGSAQGVNILTGANLTRLS